MTSKRRTNDQIFSEILKLCIKGTNKTRIIYQANLNSVKVKSHLDNLMENGFIESVRDGSRIIYKTTSKGLELKGMFEKFQTEMGDLYACA